MGSTPATAWGRTRLTSTVERCGWALVSTGTGRYGAKVRLSTLAVACVATLAVGPALTASSASVANASPAQASVSPTPKADRGLPIIRGTVGPGFTISVSRHQAPPGRYKLIVRDRSGMHNWHIRGPGEVNRKTGVPFTGHREWTVRLRVGTYRIVCDPHSSQMHTRIVVG